MLHARKDYMPIQDPRNDGIPHDEPVMLFRAQDDLFLDVLQHYRMRLAKRDPNDSALALIDRHITLAENWPVRKRADVPASVVEKSLSE